MIGHICFDCLEDTCAFYKDDKINYFVCRKCGKLWRFDVEAEHGTAVWFEELEGVDSLSMAAFEALTEAAICLNMEDLIHTCLKCQSLSYEVSPGQYKCSNIECGFKWEALPYG